MRLRIRPLARVCLLALQYRPEWTPYALGWMQPYECMEEKWVERLEELEGQGD